MHVCTTKHLVALPQSLQLLAKKQVNFLSPSFLWAPPLKLIQLGLTKNRDTQQCTTMIVRSNSLGYATILGSGDGNIQSVMRVFRREAPRLGAWQSTLREMHTPEGIEHLQYTRSLQGAVVEVDSQVQQPAMTWYKITLLWEMRATGELKHDLFREVVVFPLLYVQSNVSKGLWKSNKAWEYHEGALSRSLHWCKVPRLPQDRVA